MKKFLAFVLIAVLLLSLVGCNPPSKETENETETEAGSLSESSNKPFIDIEVYKPVIYLYPENKTEVSVKLDLDGELTHTYPSYDGGWTVTAEPDGTLTDTDGRQYYCLFWEGVTAEPYSITSGFVISGEDTERFLEDTLATLGLTDKEANEFIIYWLPRMENNAYNLISFDTSAYEDIAKLDITPSPDSILRVFMTWQALDEPVEIAPQTLPSFERGGFTVVEWGGTEIK